MDIEDVIESTIAAIRPEVRSGSGIDELCRDAHTVRRLAHASFEHGQDFLLKSQERTHGRVYLTQEFRPYRGLNSGVAEPTGGFPRPAVSMSPY
jgi:hypothetical protein